MARHHRAHEQAFQRWSNPAGNEAGDREIDPLNERGTPSFRVYSPAELQNVALRPGNVPLPDKPLAVELKETFDQVASASPIKIARFIGIGVGATLLLFAGIIGIANATDDTLSIPKEHSSMLASKAKMEANANANAPSSPAARSFTLPTPTSTPAVVSKTDFELPDQNTPAQRTAVKARTPKQGKRSVSNGGSGVTIRTAPF